MSKPDKAVWSAVRGRLLWFTGNPWQQPLSESVRTLEDGLIVMKDGKIVACGPPSEVAHHAPASAQIDHYPDSLIMPGFVDAHVHYPQMQIIGAAGEQLLDWLNKYTFVAEEMYADRDHADLNAAVFCEELLRNGTTTAATFCTSHPASVEAIFTAAAARDMELIAGKVMMDRNGPKGLLDTPELSYEHSSTLIKKWHGKGRNHYALTPRFAPCCSPEQLTVAQALRADFDDVYVQSHLCESLEEIAWVKTLFPERENYLDVYDHYGLTGPRSLYGHGIHLEENEWQSLRERGTSLVHCPTSNLFLGSGLFDLERAQQESASIPLAIGTDVGAGTSLSLIKTLAEAYKIAQLKGFTLGAFQAFYLITLGGARALDLADRVGSFAVGTMGDIVVIDSKATPLMEHRMRYVKTLEEELFVLMMLGDDRAVKATYTSGQKKVALAL